MKTRLLVPALAGILLTTTISFAQTAENPNPYAIFGRTPYVAGEKEDGAETGILVIENFAQGAKVARIEHEPRTETLILKNSGSNVENSHVGRVTLSIPGK